MAAYGFAPRWVLPVVVSALLSACGEGDGGKKPVTQVAAKVNAEEITVHQINALLSRMTNIQSGETKKVSEVVLSRLIDQELLVQRAREMKLDRDPRVMQAIDVARREILARSYMEQFVAAQAQVPTDAEIRAFYSSNPALFAERRIYSLQELNVTIPPGQVDVLKAVVSGANSLDDIVAWLKDNKVPYKAGGGIRTAEQLPMETLPRFASMKDGQAALIRRQDGVIVVYLASSRSQSLDEDKARPFIEKFLTNRKRTELARAELTRLRDVAAIEYVGAFKPAAGTDAAAHGESPSVVGADPVGASDSDDSATKSVIEKGVAGLK